jgi:hypothetical protein
MDWARSLRDRPGMTTMPTAVALHENLRTYLIVAARETAPGFEASPLAESARGWSPRRGHHLLPRLCLSAPTDAPAQTSLRRWRKPVRAGGASPFRRSTHLRRFPSPAPCFRAGTGGYACVIGAASAVRRARLVQPSKAARHSAGGRLGRGLPVPGLQASTAGAAASPR